MPTYYAEAEAGSCLELPTAPDDLQGPVKAWSAAVLIPTYMPAEGSRNPVFAGKRTYQGRSGQGYPLPYVDQVSKERQVWRWQAVHLENEAIRVMILPELGGRIHVAVDKTNGFDFLYQQDVIEPAMAGGAGATIAGGVQFRWPQYEGGSAFLPMAVQIEEHADGARTVWCNGYDPQTRMSCTRGVCLYPGRSYVEIKVRVFNRTHTQQNFAWWTNVAVPADKSYQTFLPENDDFLAGYGRERETGLVCFAKHNIAPAKKVKGPESGDVIELTSGVYTSEKSGRSVLLPYETRTFNQFLYPIRAIGSVEKANADAALSLQVESQAARVGVAVTGNFPDATVSLEWNGLSLASWTRDLSPSKPLVENAELRVEIPASDLSVVVTSSKGRELIRYTAGGTAVKKEPQQATEPPEPRKVGTSDQLFSIGTQLVQYPHAIRRAQEYWEEAIRRDSDDVRCNAALARLHLENGEFQQAEERLRAALKGLSQWHGSPTDGELYWLLGLCLRYTDRDDEAYEAFYQATWSSAWRAPGLYALAEIDVKRGRWETAPKHLHEALRLDADNNNVRCLAAIVFRQFNLNAQADALLAEAYALDPLNAWVLHLTNRPFPGNNQVRIDVALDYARAGLYGQAAEVLTAADLFVQDGSAPTIHYLLGYVYARAGQLDAAAAAYQAGGAAAMERCFPHRLEEMIALESAVMTDPTDARAFQYMGNWLYARGRDQQAIDCWEIAVKLQPQLPTAWRNLGLALFNAQKNEAAAREAYNQAFAADISDARVLYERDQLWKRLNIRPAERLQALEAHRDLVDARDNLQLELAALYNLTEQPEKALAILTSRQFQPWAGGEGCVVAQYVRTELKIAKRHLRAGELAEAEKAFQAALDPPKSLKEVKRLSDDDAEIHFWLGEAASAANDIDVAIGHWQRATQRYNETREEGEGRFTDQTAFAALAKMRLGERRDGRTLFRQLWFYGRKLAREKAKLDYFATTAAALTEVFDDDSIKRNRIQGLLLQTQARMGMEQWKLARKALEQVLALDPNHERATELVATFAYQQSSGD